MWRIHWIIRDRYADTHQAAMLVPRGAKQGIQSRDAMLQVPEAHAMHGRAVSPLAMRKHNLVLSRRLQRHKSAGG